MLQIPRSPYSGAQTQLFQYEIRWNLRHYYHCHFIVWSDVDFDFRERFRLKDVAKFGFSKSLWFRASLPLRNPESPKWWASDPN